MSKALLTGLFALTFAGLSLGCSPEVPANPTYNSDVRVIFDAHCVRCHGADDMLISMVVTGMDLAPKSCFLQRYENEGDCTTTQSPPTCKLGAGAPLCYGLAANYIVAPDSALTRMPPLPSQALNDWEQEVIKRWVAHGAPQM